MEKLFEDKRDCCGCGAFEAACPRGAVAMRPDGEGFLYPAVDAAKCVGCGLCTEVCPEHALTLAVHDGAELVVPDPEAEKKALEAAQAKKDAEKLKAEAKQKLTRVLDQVEKLDR